MKHLHVRTAFTLVELLVVVTIIGLIATSALVIVKDTAESKALTYTKKVMESIKEGFAATDKEGYFTGFVNDFGTLSPHLCFLVGKCGDDTNCTFVGEYGASTPRAELPRHRFVSMTEQNGTRFPAPFMSIDAGGGNFQEEADLKLDKVLYAGFHGGYMYTAGDDLFAGIKDGWNTPIRSSLEHNLSKKDGKAFLTLHSAGSDRSFSDASGGSLIRKEFDLSQDNLGIEALYADDYNQSFAAKDFLVSSLKIKICLKQANNYNASLLIYTPMLYDVNDSTGLTCNEYNTTHADCDGGSYLPYIPLFSHGRGANDTPIDANLSWHIGLMKLQLYFNDNNESRLYINQGGLLENDALAFDFNSGDKNLSASAFFDDIDINFAHGWSYVSNPQDDENLFYMYAGTKVVSLWENSTTDGWTETKTLLYDFKPGRYQKIEIGCD